MKLLVLSILSLIMAYEGYGQDFIDDNTMKLDSISIDRKYGLKPSSKKSIKVGSIENEYKYINALTGPNGEQIYARRLGSCCEFRSRSAAFGKGFLDQWQLTYDGLEKPIIIYLNGYDYDKPLCPFGLSYKK